MRHKLPVTMGTTCKDIFTCNDIFTPLRVARTWEIHLSSSTLNLFQQPLCSNRWIQSNLELLYANCCAYRNCPASQSFSIGGTGDSQIASRDRIVRTVDATQVSRLRGTAHPRAQARFDQGRTNPVQMISGAITFRLSAAQQADLDQLLREQQDRTSPNYHRWITPDLYAARFGMGSNDLAKVSAWLQSQGLTVDSISRNRNEIAFSGSVGQVEYAFKTELHDYLIHGEQHFANAMDVSLPAAFSAQVLGVRGLDDFHPKPRVSRASPKLTSSVTGNHFVIPGDFATIYDIPSTATGASQSIAVMGQTLISTGDLDTFRSNSGLPATSGTNFQQVLVPATGSAIHCTGDETEADLDLEWSEAVASKAKIIYVYAGLGTGTTCGSGATGRTSDVFDAVQYAIAQNIAPIISISYGNCEANLGSFVLTFQQWAQQANAQGQTISGPAGDSGAADCESGTATVATHGYGVDVPAAIPEVTGVGGSEFTGDSTQCPVSGILPLLHAQAPWRPPILHTGGLLRVPRAAHRR